MPNFDNLMQFIKKNNIDPLVVAIIIKIIFSDNSEN